jgi:fatty acid elongase 3
MKGETWFSTWYVPIIAVPLYLGFLHVCKRWIDHRLKSGLKAFDLNWLVIVHNSMLSVLSGILFLALATELAIQMNRTSFLSVFCDAAQQHTKGRLIFYYYINYMFKFVELFDTVLLVLRNKPTPFLHTYHHAATLVLCWSQLRAQSCVQWVPIVINLFIHVVMYMYYALHALRIDVWWKKYLTMLQIIQFVVGLVGCFGGLLPRTLFDLGVTSLPRCHGEYEGAFFGIGVLATYLYLFVELYKQSYSKGGKGKSAKGKSSDAAKSTQNGDKHE